MYASSPVCGRQIGSHADMHIYDHTTGKWIGRRQADRHAGIHAGGQANIHTTDRNCIKVGDLYRR